MSPLTVITGILLGCTVSISVSLAVVLLLFTINKGGHPQIDLEYPSLVATSILFAVMTVLCTVSFIGILRHRPWRWFAQAAMWLGFLFVFYYFWPD